MVSRQVQRAAFRLADQQSERLRFVGKTTIVATVAAVTPAAAADGNALVTVTWRGEPVICAGYANSYTPAIGHRVLCHVVDDQLIVAFRIVGYP